MKLLKGHWEARGERGSQVTREAGCSDSARLAGAIPVENWGAVGPTLLWTTLEMRKCTHSECVGTETGQGEEADGRVWVKAGKVDMGVKVERSSSGQLKITERHLSIHGFNKMVSFNDKCYRDVDYRALGHYHWDHRRQSHLGWLRTHLGWLRTHPHQSKNSTPWAYYVTEKRTHETPKYSKCSLFYLATAKHIPPDFQPNAINKS